MLPLLIRSRRDVQEVRCIVCNLEEHKYSICFIFDSLCYVRMFEVEGCIWQKGQIEELRYWQVGLH